MDNYLSAMKAYNVRSSTRQSDRVHGIGGEHIGNRHSLVTWHLLEPSSTEVSGSEVLEVND